MIISFVSSLDIPVTNNVLYKMIKILQEKMLNAMQWIEVCHISCQVKSSCIEVRNSPVTKSSYKIELRKITSHFELLTRVLLSELLTQLRKTLIFTSSY